MIKILLKVLTMEWEGKNFQDASLRPPLCSRRAFRKNCFPEFAVVLKWNEMNSIVKGITWKCGGWLVSLSHLFPLPPPCLLSVSTALSYCSALWVILVPVHISLVIAHTTMSLKAAIKSRGSHWLEMTGFSSVVTKLICSSCFPISIHSRKTGFLCLTQVGLHLGSLMA